MLWKDQSVSAQALGHEVMHKQLIWEYMYIMSNIYLRPTRRCCLCKRSSYCPTDIGNYALWFELLYVKVKLPVTPFPRWQVLFLDQHNYSWADVDIGVTGSLERLCNDNLMVQVVAFFLCFWVSDHKCWDWSDQNVTSWLFPSVFIIPIYCIF